MAEKNFGHVASGNYSFNSLYNHHAYGMKLALANQACSYLPSSQISTSPPSPFAPVRTPPPPPPDLSLSHKRRYTHRYGHVHGHGHGHDNDHGHGHGHDNGHGHGRGHDNDHGHGRGHGRGPDHGHGNESGHNQTFGHGQGHEHGQNRSQVHKHEHDDHHKHKHGHRHRMTPVEQQCCKWLAQVDDECVCELLGHLPPFLIRPVHEYTVRVVGACNNTYTCGAQFRI